MKIIKYTYPILFVFLLSCEDNSQLYLILREENKEVFDKNNELIKSIDEKNKLIEMKLDSLEIKQEEKLKLIDEKISSSKEVSTDEMNEFMKDDYEVTFIEGDSTAIVK